MARGRKGNEPVDLDFTLRRVFGKQSFRFEAIILPTSAADRSRPVQREVISATIEGHDVFLQAATSFGKSLCFQLPAVVGSGSMFSDAPPPEYAVPDSCTVTLVVSPLLALMVSRAVAPSVAFRSDYHIDKSNQCCPSPRYSNRDNLFKYDIY